MQMRGKEGNLLDPITRFEQFKSPVIMNILGLFHIFHVEPLVNMDRGAQFFVTLFMANFSPIINIE